MQSTSSSGYTEQETRGNPQSAINSEDVRRMNSRMVIAQVGNWYLR